MRKVGLGKWMDKMKTGSRKAGCDRMGWTELTQDHNTAGLL